MFDHYLLAITTKGEHCACGLVARSILGHLYDAELAAQGYQAAA